MGVLVLDRVRAGVLVAGVVGCGLAAVTGSDVEAMLVLSFLYKRPFVLVRPGGMRICGWGV